MGSRQNVCACTIVAQNYLPQAAVLSRSFKRHHPGIPLHILIIDDFEGEAAKKWRHLKLSIISIKAIEESFGADASPIRAMFFQYTVMEAATSVKPMFLAYLGEVLGFERILFLDPDMYVLAPLTDVFRELQKKTLVLTPHLVTLNDSVRGISKELTISVSGAFNLGFIGIRYNRPAQRFLRWWSLRLARHGFKRVSEGMFFDQKWLDLAIGAMKGVKILRDPGLNVAHWNSHERSVWRSRAGKYMVNKNTPLRLFHFSSLPLENPSFLSKYDQKQLLATMGVLNDLVNEYLSQISKDDLKKLRHLPYELNQFSNGIEIPYAVRLWWNRVNWSQFKDPFATDGEASLFNWLLRPQSDGLLGIMRCLYEIRGDLRAQFDLLTSDGRQVYQSWFFEHRKSEGNMGDRLERLMEFAAGRQKMGYEVGVSP